MLNQISQPYITIIRLGIPFSAPGSCKGFLARDRLSFGNVTVEKVPFVEAEMGGMGEMGGWEVLGMGGLGFLGIYTV